MLQRGHSGDGCVLASTLCKYALRKGNLFVLSWARVRRVRRGSLSSELLVCGGGVRSILLLPLVARCLETIDLCIWRDVCRGCDGCCVLCLHCEAWSCRCSCMGSVGVLSCRCCMFVSCVHPVTVLNAAFCMTCCLLMLVEDAIGDHTEESYSRADLITAL